MDCLVKFPNTPEIKGKIVGSKEDKFVIQTEKDIITAAKLYVFPQFPAPKKCQTDRQNSTPSKNPEKATSKKVSANGYLYCRTVFRNGKNYQQYFYHYEIREKSDQVIKSSIYVPQKLLPKIQKLIDDKKSVKQILKFLRRKKPK